MSIHSGQINTYSSFIFATFRGGDFLLNYIRQTVRTKKDCQRKMLAVFSILIEVAKNYCFIQDKSSLSVGFLPCIKIPTR